MSAEYEASFPEDQDDIWALFNSNPRAFERQNGAEVTTYRIELLEIVLQQVAELPFVLTELTPEIDAPNLRQVLEQLELLAAAVDPDDWDTLDVLYRAHSLILTVIVIAESAVDRDESSKAHIQDSLVHCKYLTFHDRSLLFDVCMHYLPGISRPIIGVYALSALKETSDHDPVSDHVEVIREYQQLFQEKFPPPMTPELLEIYEQLMHKTSVRMTGINEIPTDNEIDLAAAIGISETEFDLFWEEAARSIYRQD